MESIGINPEILISKDERHAPKTLRDKIRFVDNRYDVGLLWKPNTDFPIIFVTALQQYKRMKHRLMHDPVIHDLYSSTIAKDINCGHIRHIPTDEVPSAGRLLPEDKVLHPYKLGELRRVSNARAKYKGVCLNDMLLTGHDLFANLLGINRRFRKKRYPLSGDIEALYMQVSVRPADRKLLRFLWGETEPHFFEDLRFVFGANCSPICANFALQTCAKDHFDEDSHVKRIVRDHFYMDNLFVFIDTIQEAISFFHDLRLVLSRGGFNLTKWIGNFPEVLKEIPANHRALSHD